MRHNSSPVETVICMFKSLFGNYIKKPPRLSVKLLSKTMQSTTNYKLVDIGLNLIDAQFKGDYNNKNKHPSDIKCVINRMLENDVQKCMLTSSCIDEYYANSELCEQYSTLVPSIGFTVGVHPCSSMDMIIKHEDNETIQTDGELDISKFNKLKTIWKELLVNETKYFMAFGEFGLDYDRIHYASKDIQVKVFDKQLEIISELTKNLNNRPPAFFLHMRNCDDDLLALLDKYTFHKNQIFIIHSFTDSLPLMKKILARDNFFLSFNNCSLRTEEGLENLKHCPIDRMFLETDSPWCGIRKTHPSYPILTKALEQNKNILFYKEQQYEILKKKKINAWFETNGLDKNNYLIQDRHEPCELWKVYLLVSALKNCSYKEIVDSLWENSQKVF